MAKTKPNLWIAAYDLHFPKVHKPTFNALIDFMARNKDKIAGFVFGGDGLDNEEISHHTQGKGLYRPTGSYARNHREFQSQILDPIQENLPKTATKIWIDGNHEHFAEQLVERQPELQGLIENHKVLDLEGQGWKYIPCGEGYKLGKLLFIHGEQLTGIGNQAPQAHARKAVDVYAGNVIFGHVHNPQTFTKILPYNKKDKWQGICAPILGSTNPGYLRNRPSAWLNGFVVVETMEGGNFNAYSIVVSEGKFSFGGVLYGGTK